MTKKETAVPEYDSPWKKALENYFQPFMLFFFPVIHAEIDWKKGWEFLDTELAKIVRDATQGTRHADKLVKVFLLDGKETWLLIHIEIQGYYDKTFEKRMFVYNYRIFDAFKIEVISLAVLSDDNPKYRPGQYRSGRWGCEHNFRFPVVKVLDYGQDWEKLERDPNPFAMVVMAHLKAREVKEGQERKRWKLHLFRLLFGRGYERKDILELIRFIDWLLFLPVDLEREVQREIRKIEEENQMDYVTSYERFGRQDGMILNAREMLLEAIKVRFQEIPEDIASTVNKIEVKETLKSLLGEAITCQNIDALRKVMGEAHGI